MKTPEKNNSKPPRHQLKKVLIVGAAGAQAQLVIHELAKDPNIELIVGIDTRPLDSVMADKKVKLIKAPYKKTSLESLFDNFEFETVIHIGRVSAGEDEHRMFLRKLNINITAIETLFDIYVKRGVKNLLLISAHYVYGALPDNPTYLSEDSHLRASRSYPEMRDVVELDRFACEWMWKHKSKIRTLILRPCPVVGPNTHNGISKLFNSASVPYPIDFNPSFQFIHEIDLCRIIVHALQYLDSDVYNVAPTGQIKIRAAVKFAATYPIPIPVFAVEHINSWLKRLGLNLPQYMFDYFKYPCLLDTKKIEATLPKNFWRFPTPQQALDTIRSEGTTTPKSKLFKKA